MRDYNAKDLRIASLKSARIIRPQSSHRILNPQEYYEKFQTYQAPPKQLVKDRIDLSIIYNSEGQFLEAYKMLDPLHRKLMLDGTTFKRYIFEFYRHFTLTLIYLACDSQSEQTLEKAESFIDYFIRLFSIMDVNQFQNQNKMKKLIKVQSIVYRKLKLMTLRVRALIALTKDYQSEKILKQIQCSQQIFDEMFAMYRMKKRNLKQQKRELNMQKEGEFVLMKTTVLIDLSLLMLVRNSDNCFYKVQLLSQKCLKSLSQFDGKLSDKINSSKKQVQILQGDCDRMDLNSIYSHLLMGYALEKQGESISFCDYYQISLQRAQRILPEENLIRVLLERMFLNQNFSLIQKFYKDLKDDYKVKDALQLLFIELLKKKISFDLFGKDFNKQQSKDEIAVQKEDLEYYMQLPPTARLLNGIKKNQLKQSQSSANISSRPRTGKSSHRDLLQQTNIQNLDLPDLNNSLAGKKQNTISSNSPRGSKYKINIEDLANTEIKGKVSQIRNNLAKIMQINEEKTVMLEDDFFNQKDGNQESISNAISKSVENFFKHSIMKQLKLQSQQAPIDGQSKKVGTVIADQETSGKNFWKRFRVQQKEFEKKIYLNEKIDDFKKYFQVKMKNQNGNLERKILATPEDYEALKYHKGLKSQRKDKIVISPSQQNSPIFFAENHKNQHLKSEPSSNNNFTGSTLNRRIDQHHHLSSKIPSRRGSSSEFVNTNENFDAVMQKIKKNSKNLNIQEQTNKFLEGFKKYDAIGKIIKFNKHKSVFREAFEGNI
ncbi:UNKNOWN [Stylonychia lemnae]|uniref:Uncharacterized protein n=1 Tax=Stylonychia lemnae TaxID=5949 RepID=A0A078B8I3_STYLE|nr:UNKNOWN [Stylonychia lemnae]|eukprot:CDW89602.1 UNKNOWN [Stylonychia lemnae]